MPLNILLKYTSMHNCMSKSTSCVCSWPTGAAVDSSWQESQSRTRKLFFSHLKKSVQSESRMIDEGHVGLTVKSTELLTMILWQQTRWMVMTSLSSTLSLVSQTHQCKKQQSSKSFFAQEQRGLLTPGPLTSIHSNPQCQSVHFRSLFLVPTSSCLDSLWSDATWTPHSLDLFKRIQAEKNHHFSEKRNIDKIHF